MKNFKISILGALVFCLGFSACSNDYVEDMDVVLPFTVTVSYPERNSADEACPQIDWQTGSQLAALRTDATIFDKVILSHTSDDGFSGELEENAGEDATYAFLYPAEAYLANTNDTLTQVLALNVQDGTLAGLSRYDYIWGSCDLLSDKNSISGSVDMTLLTSVCQFQFVVDNGQPLQNITQIILTSPTKSLYQKATLSMKSGTLSEYEVGSIKISNPRGIGNEVYVALFTGETVLHFTVTTADGKAYEAVTSESIVVEQGHYYSYAPIVCQPLPLAKIGDYYYEDATWSDKIDPSKSCVGIVYALEDKSGNISTDLLTSSHGRVVALDDCQSKISWSSSASDTDGIQNFETVCDTLTIGDLPYFMGLADSFFSDDKVHQLDGIRINEVTGQITDWYTSGAISDFEGEANTLCINNNLSKYPASSYCVAFSKRVSGWYLPSVGELALVWALQQSGFLCETSKDGFNNLEQFGYWTSTECCEGEAWYINFYSGSIWSNSKTSCYNTRAVIRF